MKNSIKVLNLIILLFLTTSCDNDNIVEQEEFTSAEFTITGELKTYSTIKFENSSKLANKFLWDFGDGMYSREREPEKIYTQKGFYDISLDVTDTTTGIRDIRIKSVMIEYGRVYMRGIGIEDFPDTNMLGQKWDTDSDPDLYFELFMENIRVVDGINYIINDLNPESHYVYWSFASPYLLPDLNKPYLLKLFDRDDGESESIGYTNTVQFSELTSDVPHDTIEVKSADGKIVVNYFVEWE
ncbi:MAG: hypothetical protein SCALA702_06700 [Melioribacteraceae bacterium]|nr:MAG: hypothetical protein SCALA702_06700 [Melioribacteraceae bacterium]